MVVAQIYSMQTLEDAVAVASAGADHVGCMVSARGIPYSVDARLARQISLSVRPNSKSVIIPLSHDPSEIIEMSRSSEPDFVQLANDRGAIEMGTFASLSKELSRMGFGVIKVIAVGGGHEMEQISDYSPHADILMLDSFGPPPSDQLRGFIGGTGLKHDWALSARIVRESKLRVILAGGLNLQNVTNAIREVNPWGVDAATALDIPGSVGRKDIARVKQFIELARGA